MSPAHPNPIILEAHCRHQTDELPDLPKKLTLVLDAFYLDLVHRISERTGASKTEVIRRSLDLWVTDETLDLLYPPT